MARSAPLGPRRVDLERPSAARTYDWYLGGSTNYAIDREFGRQVVDVFPLVRSCALANRQWMQRVVRHLAKLGVRQFVDVGSGAPAGGNVHQVADEVAPDSRVVYCDDEPVAVAHSELLLEQHGDPARHAVIAADLRAPCEVWQKVLGTGVIDPNEPVALLMMAVLHYVRGDGEAERALARYRGNLPSDSCLAISHLTAEGVREERASAVLAMADKYERTSNPVRLRTREELRELFGDFELLDPGLVWVPEWHAEHSVPGAEAPSFEHPDESALLGGVARKP